MRQRYSLTQEQLAEKTGLKRSYIARLESGESNPTVKTLHRLARAVGDNVEIALQSRTQPVRTAVPEVSAIHWIPQAALTGFRRADISLTRAIGQIVCVGGSAWVTIGADRRSGGDTAVLNTRTGGERCVPTLTH
ncbi:MAG: helix-turn-helix transcriptional regulator [Chloroflexota bacterium]